MFTHIESAGCVQVPEVLLEHTPIGLHCWELEACGSGGGGGVCLWYPSLNDSLVGLGLPGRMMGRVWRSGLQVR